MLFSNLCNYVARFIISAFVSIFAHMKFFFFWLSCFMLSLSFLPCGDGKECNEKSEVIISAIGNHHDHQHASETCTPFCTCSCCASSVLYLYNAKPQNNNRIVQSQKYPFPKISFNTEVHFIIWQPPQLSA